MTKIQLSEEAIEALKLLAKAPGALPYGPELQVLWDIRFVMGNHERTHITQRGKAFITALMANE
jgi:hypothetical protein